MREKEDAAQQYLEAREAVRNAKDPKAFLRLGMLYTQGIGIGKNYVLAKKKKKKARTMTFLKKHVPWDARRLNTIWILLMKPE